MLKKILATILLLSVVLTLFVMPVSAAGSEPSSWAKEAVTNAISLGFVPENLQSNYQAAITREEFAQLFVQQIFAMQKLTFSPRDEFSSFKTDIAITKEEVLKQIKVTDFNFADTSSETVKLAYILGLMNGTSATSFEPNRTITRQEAATMFCNYSGLESRFPSDPLDLNTYTERFSDFNKTASWAKEAMKLAYFKGVFEGTSGDRNGTGKITLDPLGTFTREQAIMIADRLYKAEKSGNTIIPVSIIYIRGVVPFVGDGLGINWEISKNTITAVSLTPELVEAVTGWGRRTTNKEFMNNYSDTIRPTAGAKEFEAAIPRPGQSNMQQLINPAAMREIIQGGNHIYDVGMAEYETLNENFVFQFRLKNNGYFSSSYFGGEKMIEAYCIKVK